MEVDLLFPTIFFIMETIEGTNLEHWSIMYTYPNYETFGVV